MRKIRIQSGFTLIELMIALLVSSVVLSAVVVLASAATAASQTSDQMIKNQSRQMFISSRLYDLIRRANQVTLTNTEGFQLWHDNNADGIATANELTNVSRGAGANKLLIGTAEIDKFCTNVSFDWDAAAPATRRLTVWYNTTDNGVINRYSITARLRGSKKP